MRHLLIPLALASLMVQPSFGQAEDPEAYQDDYQQGDYGRVRYQENGATILRASSGENEAEEASSVNLPIFPGDTVRTDADQRLEVQLAAGTAVRVDRRAEVTFLSLPDPYAEHPDNTVLKLTRGRIQLSAKVRDKDNEEFRVDTPAASVYLLGDGDFRVEVDGGDRTRVLSRRGVAEVVGEGGSVLVRGGMRTVAYAGSVPDDPQSFNTFAADGFDQWVADREDVYRPRDRYARNDDSDAYEELPQEVRPYYGELSSYGRWVNVPTYGRCWYPYDVGPGWRPYFQGYWSYGPRGYFWVSNEPWGWAPYHYGRWTWAASYGWCWVPGSVFAGAWVSWSWSPSYVGWCPLDYWNRPAFYGTLHYGFYDPACWTFVSYTHLVVHDYHRYAVPLDRVGPGLRQGAVVTRPPRMSPALLAQDPPARERAVRQVLNDRAARVHPVVNRERTPQRSFSEVETVVRQRSHGSAAQPSTAAGSTNLLPGARSQRQTRPDLPGLRSNAPFGRAQHQGAEQQPGRPAESTTPYPRRITRPSPQGRAPQERTVDRTASPRSQAVPSTPPAGGPSESTPYPRRITRPSPQGRAPQERISDGRRQERARDPRIDSSWDQPPEEPRDSGARVREMYRRMASPRVTRQPEAERLAERDARRLPPAPQRQRPGPEARSRPSAPPQQAHAPAPPPPPRSSPPPPQPKRSGPAKTRDQNREGKKK